MIIHLLNQFKPIRKLQGGRWYRCISDWRKWPDYLAAPKNWPDPMQYEDYDFITWSDVLRR